MVERDASQDTADQLQACEDNLRRYHQLALAGRLVGATMHEVNNRLEALTNLIFLARTLVDQSQRAAEYLDEADTHLRGLGEITSRSLSFIRLDTEARQIDLVELASSALKLHQEQIAKKRINVQTRTPDAALAFVKRGEMFQVLTNLLLNAIDALPHSGSVHVRVAVHPQSVVLIVADNGHGIPKALRESLFDSFKSHKPEGNGLGLWVVREIVAGHGGTIRYKSSETKGKSGTVFRVSLPLHQAA